MGLRRGSAGSIGPVDCTEDPLATRMISAHRG